MSQLTQKISFLMTVIVLMTCESLYACPSCNYAISKDGTSGIQSGFNYSILFLLAVPITIFSCFSFYIFWEFRKARLRIEEQAGEEIFVQDK